MNREPVQFFCEERIGWLMLSAPPGNIMDEAFFRSLAQTIARNVVRADLIGLVVQGQGRHFSSGAEIDGLVTRLQRSTEPEAQQWLWNTTRVFQELTRQRVPVVAAISGCCLGSGLELALACHFRIAAHNAVLALPESTLGMMPGCGGCVRLPRLIGTGRALDLILSGQSLGAERALELGLVDLVVERNALSDAARQMVRRLGGAQ